MTSILNNVQNLKNSKLKIETSFQKFKILNGRIWNVKIGFLSLAFNFRDSMTYVLKNVQN